MVVRMTEQPERRLNTFFEITAIEEVSIASWRSLFEASEYPGSLAPRGLTIEKITEALTNEPLTEEMLDALLTNLELGTPAGVDVLRAEARAQGIDVAAWPEDEGPRDLVMRLWVAALTDDKVADALERAQMGAHAAGNRTVREFTGREACAPRLTSAKALGSRLRQPIASWCKAEGMSDYCEVRGCVREGEYCFEVIHGYRRQLQSVIEGQKRTILPLRPAHCDSLRYDSETGRLRVAVRAAVMVPMYREVLGKVLFDDPQFFRGDVTCTLQPLQARGQAALDDHNLGSRVAQARLVQVVWERGEHSRWNFRDRDCFAELQRLGIPLGEGQLAQAKIELRLAGPDRSRRGRRVVTVTPPNRIQVRDDAVKTVIEDYLDQIGVRSRTLTCPKLDLWSLAPWLHHESLWRALYADVLDQLLSGGIVVQARLDRVTHPDYPNHPGALRVEVLERDGRESFHGVSEDEDVPARALTSSEVSGLRLDPARLARSVAAALGLTGSQQEVQPGIWDLGHRSFESAASIHVFLATRDPKTPAATAVHTLTRLARPASPVVLVPAGRDAGLGLPQVEGIFPGASYDRLLPAIIQELDLGSRVPAVHYAPATARLVVDRRFKQAWLDRVLLTALRPDTQPFDFTALVAAAGGKPVDTKDLDRDLARRDGAAKEARRDAIVAMQQSFEDASHPVPADLEKLFSNTRGSYRVTVPALVV